MKPSAKRPRPPPTPPPPWLQNQWRYKESELKQKQEEVRKNTLMKKELDKVQKQNLEEIKTVMQSWEKGWDEVIDKGKDEKASRKGFGKARQGLRRSDEEASTKIFNN